jgi:hypothetical protein
MKEEKRKKKRSNNQVTTETDNIEKDGPQANSSPPLLLLRTQSDPCTPTVSNNTIEPVRRLILPLTHSYDAVADERVSQTKREFTYEHKDLDERGSNIPLDRLREETVPTVTKGHLKRKVDRAREDEGRCRERLDFQAAEISRLKKDLSKVEDKYKKLKKKLR